jgi:hypothetical protein
MLTEEIVAGLTNQVPNDNILSEHESRSYQVPLDYGFRL